MIVTLDNGSMIALGTTETAATIAITDYSRRVTDDFGVTTVVRRGFSRRMSLRFALPFEEAGRVQSRLAELRATPALWVADDRWRALSVRGLLKDFEIDLAVPPQSYCSLSVDGLAETDVTADPGGDPAIIGDRSTLRMLRPLPVTDTVLTTSSAVEDDVSPWSAATAYADAARVRRGHRVFESLIAGNLNNDPTRSVGKWIDIGPTNRWAMFDQAIGTATRSNLPLVITLATGDSDTVALLDVAGATVRVEAAGYDRVQAVGKGALMFAGLPGGPITVTIAGPGNVAVGTLLVGQIVALGVTEANPTAGIIDYSRKEVDDFGEITIVQRAWSKRMQARALIRSDAVDTVLDRIAAVRAVPTLWIGDDDNDALTIHGFFKDVSIEIGDKVSKVSLSIEGLSQAARVEPVTATWSTITGPGKPSDDADVTVDAIEEGRFKLVTPAARAATEQRPRFDPIFWTTNFPNTMMAALRADPGELRLDAVFHERSHLAGLIWESIDRWDHPTTSYDTNQDYRGCTLTFRLRLLGEVLDLADVNGPVLTIEGRDASGNARTWYVRLKNAVVSGSGSDTDARISLDFDDLRAGFYGDERVFAGDIDRMFLSLVPRGYGGSGRLDVPIEGALILSEMVVSGRNATLTCGRGPGALHRLRMTNGYDDTYNIAPGRILRNLELLGYSDIFNHYVGMSHYFRWAWDGTAGRYIAQDVAEPLNTPCVLWHRDLAAKLHAGGFRLILSLSYEMLDSFAPAAFRQMDATGNPALTGWVPPSTLFSPCNAGAMDYLARVARQFCRIAADAGMAVDFQVGEPWYWIDFRTQTPCFYDGATVQLYAAETGRTAPAIASMTQAMDAAQLHFLDWLGVQLGKSILALMAAVRADHPAMTSYVLLYLPQLLHEATPEVHRVNMPANLAYPAIDVLQLEDYDFVIDGRPDLSERGRAAAERKLRYPRSRQHYFGGFALFRDTGQIWRNTTNAMVAADEYGVPEVFVWAYTQVMRDGYMPVLRNRPPLTLLDLLDVDVRTPPGDGDTIVYDGIRRKWVCRKAVTGGST